MAKGNIQCGKCGRVNPPQVRICIDCGAILASSDDIAGVGTGFRDADGAVPPIDNVNTLREERNPLEQTGEVVPLSTVERFDRDESHSSEVMSGIERIGDDVVEDESDPDPFERSRAFEVEHAASWHGAGADDEPLPLHVELETADDAEKRTSRQAVEFHETEKIRAEHEPSGPRIAGPGAPLSEFEHRSKTVPKHRRAWERSDVEIMTRVRRKNLAKAMIGRSMPLIVFGLALAIAARFVLFPVVLPGGTWGGTLVDKIGDSQMTHFTIRLTRSGDELRGMFWLALAPGGPPQPDAKIAVPYSLQPVYSGGPIPVVGRFDRHGMTLRAYRNVGAPEGPHVDFDGAFEGWSKATGTAVTSKNVSSEWELWKNP